MDEDAFNMQVRKFLKNVGVTSQREIETAIRDAVAAGKVGAGDTVDAKVVLSIESLGMSHEIKGSIDLE